MKSFGIANLLKQAQQVQEEIQRIKQELSGMKVTGTSGGGMVTVTANGKQQIIDIKIDSEAIKMADREMLEDLIVAAVNQALERSQELANEQMSKVTGGILNNLPEGMKIPGLNL
jgi:DNA-binding YbaB/EbfC family protein